MSFKPNKAFDPYFDWANLILGGLLFLSPWVLQYTAHAVAPWHAWVGGIIVAVVAVAALTRFAEWEEWLEAVVGVWLAASPWILGFSAIAAAMWAHLILGVLIAVVALIRGWRARTHATA